jgi:hypothetical protein
LDSFINNINLASAAYNAARSLDLFPKVSIGVLKLFIDSGYTLPASPFNIGA